jgi:hypothetical protein
MFTFSPGFEAATLKIPNKELTAYGSGAGPIRPSYSQGYQGSNDPYNLVTVNQGGVLVDGGRDGTTASWPAAPIHDDSPMVQANGAIPPRKQIIGFAKFSTRSEALTARDVLQGRRVDAEKGAVLKAEMAKKNLHTKRGVGQASIPGMPSLLQGAGMSTDIFNNGLAGIGSPTSASEVLRDRDRELGPLGAMGIGQRARFASGDDDLSRDGRRGSELMSMMSGLGQFGTRGPRERAEEDERERSKRELRMRQTNSSAYEAFHSVPPHIMRSHEQSLSDGGASLNGLNALSHSLSDGMGMNAASNPWGMPTREAMLANGINGGGARRPTLPFNSYPPRPPSTSQLSAPEQDAFPLSASRSASSSQSGMSDPENTPNRTMDSGLSPPTEFFVPSGMPRSRGRSPSTESQPGQVGIAQSSELSNVAGPLTGAEQDMIQPMSDLAIGTQIGSTSPDLPSPTSNASSGNRNAADQNPPVS